MRHARSFVVVGGLALLTWAGGVSTSSGTATPPRAAVAPVAVPATPVETDEARRTRLNARLQEMVREGRGSRLSETPARRAAAPARVRTRAAAATPFAPAPAAAPAVIDRPETSSFAPPPFRPGAVRSSNGGRYTPPRLDLSTPPNPPTDDVECLTQAIYYEARNESEEGQAAVAEVVINRSRAGTYPRKICAVVYQRNSRTCQFTFTCDGSIGRSRVNPVAWARAERIARSVYEGRSAALLPKTSVNYHANYVSPSWGRRLARVRQIGAHIFYGAPLDGRSTPGAAATARPEPAQGGLQFVRNEALDRAFALLGSEAPPAAAPAETR